MTEVEVCMWRSGWEADCGGGLGPVWVFLSRGSSGYSRMLPQQRPDGDYRISKSTWRTSGLRCYRGTKQGEQQIRQFPGILWHQTDIDFEEFTVLVPWVLSPGGPPRPRVCQWCSPRVSAWSSPAPPGSLPAEFPAERKKKPKTFYFVPKDTDEESRCVLKEQKKISHGLLDNEHWTLSSNKYGLKQNISLDINRLLFK